MRSTQFMKIGIGTLLVTVALLAIAQSQSAKFEAASIKPSMISAQPVPGSGQIFTLPITVTGARLLARGTTLRALVQFAYGSAEASRYAAIYTVVDGPAFIDKDRYDVEAKSESPIGVDAARIMLRSLLEERCGLAVHTETRELPVYHLLIGKGGLKMKQLSAETKGYLRPNLSTTRLEYAAPMSRILDSVQAWTDRLIIDLTGLTGVFEMTMADNQLSSLDATGTESVSANLLPRFEEQTGLRLVPAKDTVSVTVIDHVQKPDAN